MDAGQHLAVVISRKHLVHDIGVTVKASALGYSPVASFDLNGFMEVFERKGQRVEEAVVALHDPFADRVMRQVAIVAHGDVTMAGVLPRIVVTLHDVAIGAGGRVVAEVAPAFAVTEGEGADSCENTEEHGQDDRKERGTAWPLARGRGWLAWAGYADKGVVHESLRCEMCVEMRLDPCLEYLGTIGSLRLLVIQMIVVSCPLSVAGGDG
jgi:hypothetical protein